MSRVMLFYSSNILLVLYLILVFASLFTKDKNYRLLFIAASTLLFGLAMGIILFWLPYDADPSIAKKTLYTITLIALITIPTLLSRRWKLNEKIQAFFEKKKNNN